MFSLTITLRDTPHQIVLWYKGVDTIDAASRSFNSQWDDGIHFVSILDDFGSVASFEIKEFIASVRSDARLYLQARNARRILEQRANNDYNNEMLRDPTLKFLVGED